MNKTRGYLGIAAVLGSCFMACNYTDGECFPREELYETVGAGGGPIVPTGVGAGGYGQVPFKPQSVDPDQEPVCNIISGGPCDDKCQAQYDADSIECAKIADDAQRRACQDTAHAKYKACQDNCEHGAIITCHDKYMWCIEHAPFHPCMHTIPKTSDTVCRFCQKECERGAYPSSDCRACGF
ncbi:hypothetical protein [Polyangium jinanense]|uniref:Lipoprotein n=1 Tax=Polyangium jinanense TaxID=2829994 RepID=A0A9X3X142_9BACT|nr:hypothetical protein [Polyangium jinanense]MDC3954572.1 hypothetical protein [Polyangium jinanense]MDC3980875.1 hypothetical protein [Polyangium jinanense]